MAEVDERIRAHLAAQNEAKAAEAADSHLPPTEDLLLDDEPITLSD